MERQTNHLDLFPDSGVVLARGRGILYLPTGAQEASAMILTDAGTWQPASCILVHHGEFSVGVSVSIGDKEGTIRSIGPNFVDLELLGRPQLLRLYDVKTIVMDNIRGNGYLTEPYPRNGAILTGLLPGLGWSPFYQIVLGPTSDSIASLTLFGQIHNPDRIHLDVNSLTLHTGQSLPSRNRDLQLLASQAPPGETPLLAPMEFKVSDWAPDTLYSYRSVVLFSQQNLRSTRQYLLRLDGSSLIQYGYLLPSQSNLPSGSARILRADLSLAGQGQVLVRGTELQFWVGPEENLLVQAEVRRGGSEEARRTTFRALLTSKFQQPVPLRVELPYREIPTQVTPGNFTTEAGQLVWQFEIRPGQQLLEGQVLSS